MNRHSPQSSFRPPPRHPSVVNLSTDNNRAVKRRRLSHADHSTDSWTSTPGSEDTDPVESIDLTEVDGSADLAKALSKQREDAVKAQQDAEPQREKGSSVLTAYKCPVCMDTLDDATSTACGMLR